MFNFDVNALAESIKPAADNVAQSLGASLADLWTIGIRGQFAEGIGYLSIALLLVIMEIVGWIFIVKFEKSDKYSEGVGYGLGVLFSVFILTGIFFLVYYGVLHVVAPDYAVLLEIKNILTSSN